MMIASYMRVSLVLTWRTVAAPAGTFIARVRNGAIQMPPPLLAYCQSENWTLFHFRVANEDQLTMLPVLPEDSATEFQASLDSQGTLWIPADIRKLIDLREQSVMLRVEDGAISMYLRKVFDTLGFRPHD
jgi:hypothetical protein